MTVHLDSESTLHRDVDERRVRRTVRILMGSPSTLYFRIHPIHENEETVAYLERYLTHGEDKAGETK